MTPFELSVILKSHSSGVSSSRFKSQLYHFLPVGPQASYLSSLGSGVLIYKGGASLRLRFLTYKVRLLLVLTSKVIVMIQIKANWHVVSVQQMRAFILLFHSYGFHEPSWQRDGECLLTSLSQQLQLLGTPTSSPSPVSCPVFPATFVSLVSSGTSWKTHPFKAFKGKITAIRVQAVLTH